ncbi:MAG: phage BR0599 family protein [Xanthomonadaceae bacterium]|jgi:uncharacterized phage protein (TIGR02218 family)|nr:phage BR0599 family protein [Xanthomonadaceae bacterium]
MSTEARERSWHDGEPLLLLRFACADRLWRYTTADHDYRYGADLYTAVPGGIGCASYTEGAELRKLTRTITVPTTLEVIQHGWPYPSSTPITLTVMTTHEGEDDVWVDWIGRIVGVRRLNHGVVELKGEPSQTAARQRALNRCWQRACPLVLYSQGEGQCNVNPEQYAVTGIVAALSGLTVYSEAVVAFPFGRLVGGYIEYTRDGGLIERRGVAAQLAWNAIQLEYGAPDLSAGTPVRLYPGCAQTFIDCAEYFGNQNNYGGIPWLPTRSPFDGHPLW